MNNNNIKTVFIENGLATKEFINALRSESTAVYEVDKSNLPKYIYNETTPLFHCCALGSEEFIGEAKNIRCIKADNLSISSANIKTFLEWGRLRPYEISETEFIENDIDISDAGHLESVFALGNGYIGLRGTYDEQDDNISEVSGMYINGIFEKEPLNHLWPCRGFAKNEQYTVNLCDWRIFEVYVDGEKACLSNGLDNHKRVLDFIGGKIVRSFSFTTKKGKTVNVESIRNVNNLRPHSAQIKYTVTADNFSGDVAIKSTVIKNTPINGKLTTNTVKEFADEDELLLEVQTKNSKKTVAAAFEHIVKSDEYESTTENTDNKYTYTVIANLKKGASVSVEKYAAFYSSEDNLGDMLAQAKNEAVKNKNNGFDVLLEEQKSFWKEHWKNGDIKIEGNPGDQQAIRLSLFHLKSQLPAINNASIGATGLTGPNYSGKVFWDTEMYLMPYYLFTDMSSCKGLLRYRIKLLDKARERAGEIGNTGALYSWCSIDGEETSVVFEASTAEYHINADIAYAVWRYEQVTEDCDFVYNECSEMLFETAKFYAHRGSFVDAYDGRFCLNSVCGPDEYACGVNNNCYTNFMVQFHLRYALDVYDRMLKSVPEKLYSILSKTDIDENELNLWKNAADKMYYKINDKYGIYEQDDKFVYNDAVDMNTIPKNYDIRSMFHPLDLWRMQVLKQADVVLLQFVLGNKFTLDEKKKNYDYYEPKTNHGSSLSAAVHSIAANEIGYSDEAYEYFKSTAYMDIGDFKKNTSGGVHIACLGGVWMSVINGFMGMRMYEDGLYFSPNLPKNWDKCTFRINYKKSLIEVSVNKENSLFTLVSGEKLFINVYGEKTELKKDEVYITKCR